MTVIDKDFHKAVTGWKQAVGIIERLHKSLEFSMAELTRVSKEHPLVLGENKNKAAQYQEGVYALDQAKAYLAAMETAGAR